MSDIFKFKVSKPRGDEIGVNIYQTLYITMQAPVYMFHVTLNDRLNDPEAQKRLGMAELKVKMIEALLNGEWEFDENIS